MAMSTTKTSLEAIPLLKGRENYISWSQQMESHLKASKAWKIINGKWKRPSEPSRVLAPLRPQDLIDEHREERRQQEEAQAEDEEATPLPPYVPLSLREAKEELEYIKAQIDQWDQWEKAERTAINDINSRLSETCRKQLGRLDNLKNIWDKLKTLYAKTTCGIWVQELNNMVKLIGARKTGENPDEWLGRVIATAENGQENLGNLSWDIFAAYVMSINLGDDITATPSETYRQSEWPSMDSLRNSISQEYQSKLNANTKSKPTAAARPNNEDPKLSLTLTSRKRKGTRLSSPHKKQDSHNDGEKKGRQGWPKCPICDTQHPIREKGDCFLARPETASAAWREKNQDRIEAFKKKKSQ
jgi:hypothetical protein